MAIPIIARILGGLGGKKGGNIISGIGSSIKDLRENIPTLEDEVTVEVVGQPGVSKQQLYFLALACANGIVRRFGSLTPNPVLPPAIGVLMIEYDAADNWVRCIISYKCGTTAFALDQLAPGSPFDRLAVYRGPQCKVVGGTFDFVNTVLPGIPSSAGRGSAPTMPFTGQVILDPCPTTTEPTPGLIVQSPVPSQPITSTGATGIQSPNPKPPGDNRSRGVIPSQQTPGKGTGTGQQTPGTGTGTGPQLTNPGYGTAGGPRSGPTGKNECCVQSMKLVPMIFAALTDPGSLGKITFTPPTPGPRGG